MPVTVAPERPVNIVTAGAQAPGDVALLASGRTVAAWIDESTGAGVAKLRLYGPDGAPSTGEITVGAASDVVLVPQAGGFTVLRVETIGSQQGQIVANRYDLVGEPLVGGQQVIRAVDTRNTPTLFTRDFGLEATPLSDGGYVVGWTNTRGDSLGFVSLSNGQAVVSAAGAVETTFGRSIEGADRDTPTYDTHMAFAELPGGQILATWRVGPQFGSTQPPQPPAQMVQLLDLQGRALGSPQRLDSSPPTDGQPAVDSANGLAVAALPDGRVAFAWSVDGVVRVSIYSLTGGQPTGRTLPEVLTLEAGAGDPQLVVLEDGSLVVGYTQGGNVVADLINSSGRTHTPHVELATVTAGVQDQLRLATDNGALAAVWRDLSGLGASGQAGDPSGGGVKLALHAFELRFAGGPGAETVTGGAANDFINGGFDHDHLFGAGGDDRLDGGIGSDSLVGGAGSDTIVGGAGFDRVGYRSAPGPVTVDLVARVAGGDGVDQLREVEGVFGSNFNDVLRGNFLSNLLDGGAGDDLIDGDTGSNHLDGDVGTDTLVLLGSVSDYFVTGATAQGATIIGPYGTNTALNFERVRLDTGEISWTQFTSQAFNGLRYIASNPDLITAFGADAERGRQHWTIGGQFEGRPLASFDPLRYAASNPDLLAQFGNDARALTLHYIQTGFAAGRSATSFDPLQYGAANADLLLALGADATALTRHYASAGVHEGRPKTGFDPLLYGASNEDLARVFGANADALFQHWIRAGVYEGRPTSGFSPLFYAAANDDLARVFGTDTAGALRHYLVAGVHEGRATFGFDLTAYKLSYPELLAGFSNEQLLTHWLTVGADQGLRGDELFGREQFGTDQLLLTSVTSELRNFTTSGRFSADRDWFVVSGSRQVTIQVSGVDSGGGTLADPRLEVYDVDGRLIAADEDSGPGRDPVVTVGPSAAPIFVVVRSASEAEGTYRVSVDFSSSAAGDGWVM